MRCCDHCLSLLPGFNQIACPDSIIFLPGLNQIVARIQPDARPDVSRFVARTKSEYASRAVSDSIGAVTKLDDKYDLLSLLFAEYIRYARLFIPDEIDTDERERFFTEFETRFNNALQRNKSITASIDIITHEMSSSEFGYGNFGPMNFPQVLAMYINDGLSNTEYEIYEQYDEAIGKIIALLELLPDFIDSRSEHISTISGYRNFMRNSQPDLVFSWDVAFGGRLFNRYHGGALQEVYHFQWMAIAFWLLVCLFDIMSVICGYHSYKVVYSLEPNKKILEIGYLRYDTGLRDYLAPKNEGFSEEICQTVGKLMHDTTFSDTAIIKTLKDEFFIDIPLSPNTGADKDPTRTSLESFRCWLADYINNNKMYANWKKSDESADLLLKSAIANNMNPQELDRKLRKAFIVNGTFDYNESLLREIDGHAYVNDELGLHVIDCRKIEGFSAEARLQLNWVLGFYGLVDVSELKQAEKEGYLKFSTELVVWLRELKQTHSKTFTARDS